MLATTSITKKEEGKINGFSEGKTFFFSRCKWMGDLLFCTQALFRFIDSKKGAKTTSDKLKK